MVSKYAVERTLAWYILITMVAVVNLFYIENLWLRLVNLFLYIVFTILFIQLYREWKNLIYNIGE